MLKWSEIVDGETLYEAFLPETDKEGNGWRLRAVRRGHIVAERAIPLTHCPTFGPDVCDVQTLEAALEKLMETLRCASTPEGVGAYEAGPVLIPPPDPALHSSVYALKESFLEAIAVLELDPDWICELLELREGWTVEELYPVSITQKRESRMQRVVALKTLTKLHPSLAVNRAKLLDSILVDDVETTRTILRDFGIRTD